MDVIKIMASGGHLTPGTHPDRPQFSRAELRAAVDEGHRHGLPVTAHAHGTDAIADAVAAGVDCIEHATFQGRDGIRAPERLVRAIAERHIIVSATVGAVPGVGTASPEMAKRLPAILANHARLHRAGAPLLAGTDAGIAPAKRHDTARYAIGHLVYIGLTPAEALRANTSLAAAACGIGHRKGRLAPGFDADILAVDGNPFTEPEAMHRIRAIYVRGIPVSETARTYPAITAGLPPSG